MSQLDRYFNTVGARGLDVKQSPAMGESTLAPGFLYFYAAATVSTIFAIAQRAVADVAGMRIAFKCISGVAEEDTPGLLKLITPPGQSIEDDEGTFNVDSLATCGEQLPGAYREWLCDPDGNWLMVGRGEGAGALPLGQIVIQGIPVVIQGVPLVNTFPAPLMKKRLPAPIIAKPAIIVPRSAPLARPLGPTLLSGDVIELEDAFDDTSLEMNATGDKFRVAEDLQGEVSDHDAAIAALETDVTAAEAAITTLEGEVTTLETEVTAVEGDVSDQGAELDALQFRFPLRKNSTPETSYEEIGLLRFDATPYGAAFVIVAELEVTAAGQTAQLELFNLTAGTTITTLSGTLTTTQKITASITLPLSEALYSVRLRRVGGSVNQLVSCRSAAFKR